MPMIPRLVSMSVLVALIIVMGLMFFQVIAPFLLPLFLAGVAAVLCGPLQGYFLNRTDYRVRLASGLTTTVVMFAVLVPLAVGITIATLQLYTFAANQLEGDKLQETTDQVREFLAQDRIVDWIESVAPGVDREKVEEFVKTQTQDTLETLKGQATSAATAILGGVARSVLGGLVGLMVGLLIFGVALYYFLSDAPAFLDAAERLVPVPVEYQERLFGQFNTVVRAVVVSTFLAALAQAILTSVMLTFAGFSHFFLLFVLSTFSALIPLAGTWLVWGPCALLLLAQGHIFTSIAVILFGGVVIGTIDNVIRTYVLNSDAKLHPLLALISVLGGLQVMGLWGVFIGPVIASILHGLMVIFNEELKKAPAEPLSAEEVPTPTSENPPPTPEPVVESTPTEETTPSAKPKSRRKKRRKG